MNTKNIRIVIFALLCMLTSETRAEDDLTLLKSAHRGNVSAMRRIGIRMHKRLCSRGDPATGIRWLEKAAERGDSEAMYYLGRVRMAQNREVGKVYIKRAADLGNVKAIAYRNKTEKSEPEITHREPEQPPRNMVEQPAQTAPVIVERVENNASTESNTRTAPEERPIPAAPSGPAIDADSVDNTMRTVAATVRQKTTQVGVTSIAMVKFLCNGSAANKLADAVCDKMQEALLEADCPEIRDRVDAAMLVQEGNAQRETVAMSASSAVFMGEIICQPGDDIGYFIYRIFSMGDMRILAAGFEPVKWNTQEKKLLNGSSYKRASACLPFISKENLGKVVSKVKDRVHCGIAMVHDGGANENNTVEHRVAFAQVLAALQQAGCALYEREFFQQAAQEASLSDRSVSADKVGALCNVKLEQSSGTENNVKVKVTSYPGGGLLSIANVSQLRGAAVGTMTGNNDANNLDDMLADINKEESDVQLVYEYECDITDDYVIPKEIFGRYDRYVHVDLYIVRENYNEYESSNLLDREGYTHPVVVAARTSMQDLARAAVRKFGNKRDDIKKNLEHAALIGFCKNGIYVGPLQLCMLDAARNLLFRENSGVHGFEIRTFLSDIASGEIGLSGKYKCRWSERLPAFTYETEITWQGGLPLHVRCRVDFTLSKAILLKKSKKD